MVADVAGYVRQRIAAVDESQGLGIAAVTHKSHVIGDVLLDGTGLHAGRNIAVEHGKTVVDLGLLVSAEGSLRVCCIS